MQALVKSLALITCLSTPAWAVIPATPATTPVTAPVASAMTASATPSSAAAAPNAPLTAEQISKEKGLQEAKVKAMVKDQATRLQQLEKANLDALAQNQELQLNSDSLAVQVQVLQSETSAQMFLYGALTLAIGVLLGFLIASYIYTKRRRQW